MESISPTLSRKLTIATMVGVLVIVLFMSFTYWDVQQDDSYIFFAYAKNIANGRGYVFNVGEQVNATTSPLYTLLLAGGYALFRFLPFVIIPLIGHLVGAVSLFILCFLLMQSFAAEKGTLFPFILPLVFLTLPLLPAAVGMETFLALMLAMAAITFYVQERLQAAALACSLAILARPDMLLLAALLAGYHAIRARRLPRLKLAGKVAVVFLLPLLAWTIFSLIYFGSPLPTSLSAKLAQTEAGLWGSGPVFFDELWEYFLSYGQSGLRTVLIAVVLCGLVVLLLNFWRWTLFRQPAFHLILFWMLAYALVYGLILEAPGYGWYYTPLALGVALLAALPLEGLYRLLGRGAKIRERVFLPAVYLILVVIGLGMPSLAPVAPVWEKYDMYRRAAEWLNDNAPPGASVGAGDIGVLGYYYENGPVIDAAGLVTPDVIEHLRAGEFTWYVQHYQPEYLMFAHPPRRHIEAEMAGEQWFRRQYYVEQIIISPTMRVAIYQRVND
jgi:hypothetical protein